MFDEYIVEALSVGGSRQPPGVCGCIGGRRFTCMEMRSVKCVGVVFWVGYRDTLEGLKLDELDTLPAMDNSYRDTLEGLKLPHRSIPQPLTEVTEIPYEGLKCNAMQCNETDE